MEHTLIFIILIALSSYSITDLLVNQDGPFMVFAKIRTYFGIVELADGMIALDPDKKYFLSHIFCSGDYNLVASILNCPYCTSVWTTFILTIVCLLNHNLLIPFAAMGLVTFALDLQ